MSNVLRSHGVCGRTGAQNNIVRFIGWQMQRVLLRRILELLNKIPCSQRRT